MSITGLILAGGLGTRMGGADKGWVEFEGRSLIERLIAQLQPQVDKLIISANRNLERYAALGFPVVTDLRPDHAGPLAGIETGLSVCETDWLLTCPVNTLNLPADYAQRMLQAAPSVAFAGGHLQPVFMLVPRGALASLSASLDGGNGKVRRWTDQVGLQQVSFDDMPGALCNLNDWQALQQAQQ
ncbi:MAG: molybdenum cofactor guanylyltransferase MobA [Rhodocyclaceae bacterium]